MTDPAAPRGDLTPQEREQLGAATGIAQWFLDERTKREAAEAHADHLADRVVQREKERDEAERKAGEVARRVAELEATTERIQCDFCGEHVTEPANSPDDGRPICFACYSKQTERRLQQATEALREAADDLAKAANQFAGLGYKLNESRFAEKEQRARSSLAALAGEDDGPPQPQREGDYL